MANKNDSLILNLKDQIESKIKNLVVTEFKPVTNCSLKMGDKTYNLHTVDNDTAMYLYAKLSVLNNEIKAVFNKPFMYHGYDAEFWMQDLFAKVKNNEYKQEKAKLQTVLAELDNKLSDDVQTNLWLTNLTKSLGL